MSLSAASAGASTAVPYRHQSDASRAVQAQQQDPIAFLAKLADMPKEVRAPGATCARSAVRPQASLCITASGVHLRCPPQPEGHHSFAWTSERVHVVARVVWHAE